jgi:hypothetical protein
MNRDLIKVAYDLVAIHDVTLLSHGVKVEDDFDPKIQLPDHAVNLQWGAKEAAIVALGNAESTTQDAFWNVKFHTQARIVKKHEGKPIPDDAVDFKDSDVIANLSAVFLACYFYKASASDKPNEAALAEFARYNVPLQVWPYWREWLQSACRRIGLPVVQLPQQIFDGQLAKDVRK